jgi:hypothetical protein
MSAPTIYRTSHVTVLAAAVSIGGSGCAETRVCGKITMPHLLVLRSLPSVRPGNLADGGPSLIQTSLQHPERIEAGPSLLDPLN